MRPIPAVRLSVRTLVAPLMAVALLPGLAQAVPPAFNPGINQAQVQVPFTIPVDTPTGAEVFLVQVGDLDGDGVPELAIGLPDGVVGDATGRVVVADGADGSLLFTVIGGPGTQRFGQAVAAVGDRDGDGLPEIAIGAPGSVGSSQPGSVTLVDGATGVAAWTVSGDLPGDLYGYALTAVDDNDLDGVADLLVGAPLDAGGGLEAGRLALLSTDDGVQLHELSGAPGDLLGQDMDHEPNPMASASQLGNPGAGYFVQLSATGLAVQQTVTSSGSLDAFGSRVAVFDDLDGDGVPEVLASTDPVSVAGSVRVHDGATGALVHELSAATVGSGFGRALASLGDVDGDGVGDFAVGEPLSDVNGNDSGTVHVFSGADFSALRVIHGSAGGRFGAALCAAGDVNQDGLGDLLVSSRDPVGGGAEVSCLTFSRWSVVGVGTPGTPGLPNLTGHGGLLPGTPVTLRVGNALAQAPVSLVIGSAVFYDTLHDVISPIPESIVPLTTSAFGEASYDFVWPAGVAPGTVMAYQARIADAGAAHGEALSPAITSEAP